MPDAVVLCFIPRSAVVLLPFGLLQEVTAEMRSMLLCAHEALISSNAWLVDRLKAVEVKFYHFNLSRDYFALSWSDLLEYSFAMRASMANIRVWVHNWLVNSSLCSRLSPPTFSSPEMARTCDDSPSTLFAEVNCSQREMQCSGSKHLK